ncbi:MULTISPECIES: hypothetical protein [Microbacterium]|nr:MULTISPECIES: hypothetical protein [Microbacterium]
MEWVIPTVAILAILLVAVVVTIAVLARRSKPDVAGQRRREGTDR